MIATRVCCDRFLFQLGLTQHEGEQRLRRCSAAAEVSPGDEQKIQLTQESGCYARGEIVIILGLLEGVENEICPAT